MRTLQLAVVLATACVSVSDERAVVESGSNGAVERDPCIPQAWPIVEDGHQLDRVTIEDAPGLAIYWVPPEPHGLVIVLHANKKNASAMFTVEHEELYNEFADRNLAYVAVTNTGGDWNLMVRPENPDYARVMAVRDHLIKDTAITKQTPLFAVGFSGGSMFAPVFARIALEDGWDVRGFSSHNTGPKATAEVPSVFVAHENDNPKGLVDAYEDQATLGYETTLFYLSETLLDPLRFTKEPNITEDESIAFFDELVAYGLVDVRGQRIVSDDVELQALDWFNRNSIYDDSSKARHQLSVLWRNHVFSADRACAEARMFEEQL